jgi:hypothetical protein
MLQRDLVGFLGRGGGGLGGLVLLGVSVKGLSVSWGGYRPWLLRGSFCVIDVCMYCGCIVG